MKSRFVGWHAQFEWKLEDLWIGVFWKRLGNCIDVWICLVPCVPLHVSWWWTNEPTTTPPKNSLQPEQSNKDE